MLTLLSIFSVYPVYHRSHRPKQIISPDCSVIQTISGRACSPQIIYRGQGVHIIKPESWVLYDGNISKISTRTQMGHFHQKSCSLRCFTLRRCAKWDPSGKFIDHRRQIIFPTLLPKLPVQNVKPLYSLSLRKKKGTDVFSVSDYFRQPIQGHAGHQDEWHLDVILFSIRNDRIKKYFMFAQYCSMLIVW